MRYQSWRCLAGHRNLPLFCALNGLFYCPIITCDYHLRGIEDVTKWRSIEPPRRELLRGKPIPTIETEETPMFKDRLSLKQNSIQQPAVPYRSYRAPTSLLASSKPDPAPPLKAASVIPRTSLYKKRMLSVNISEELYQAIMAGMEAAGEAVGPYINTTLEIAHRLRGGGAAPRRAITDMFVPIVGREVAITPARISPKIKLAVLRYATANGLSFNACVNIALSMLLEVETGETLDAADP